MLSIVQFQSCSTFSTKANYKLNNVFLQNCNKDTLENIRYKINVQATGEINSNYNLINEECDDLLVFNKYSYKTYQPTQGTAFDNSNELTIRITKKNIFENKISIQSLVIDNFNGKTTNCIISFGSFDKSAKLGLTARMRINNDGIFKLHFHLADDPVIGFHKPARFKKRTDIVMIKNIEVYKINDIKNYFENSLLKKEK
ncbi:MAG: hypothetical protein K8S23_09420 [Candidatus Cloacimonetes bacterium]|nr:hypothetical protein [Candidatus Cloacimonadota bacterium]